MTTAEERALLAEAVVRQFVPQYRTVPKSRRWYHRAIGRILGVLGSGAYMQRFWTTLGYETGRPLICEAGSPANEWSVILHEGVHAVQARRWSRPLFAALYLMPQLLAIIAVVALPAAVVLRWWWVLGLLVAGLPWPAAARRLFEREAYAVEVAAEFWHRGGIPDPAYEAMVENWLIPHFAGPAYYWMWPFKNDPRRFFWGWLRNLRGDAAARRFDPPLPNLTLRMTPYLQACRDLAERFRAEDGAA